MRKPLQFTSHTFYQFQVWPKLAKLVWWVSLENSTPFLPGHLFRGSGDKLLLPSQNGFVVLGWEYRSDRATGNGTSLPALSIDLLQLNCTSHSKSPRPMCYGKLCGSFTLTFRHYWAWREVGLSFWSYSVPVLCLPSVTLFVPEIRLSVSNGRTFVLIHSAKTQQRPSVLCTDSEYRHPLILWKV